MRSPDMQDLLAAWPSTDRAPPHDRLARLLATVVAAETLAGDRLGDRHRRLLMLHRDLSDRPIEGRVLCDTCRASVEFTLPVAAMLGGDPGDAGAIVTLTHDDRDYLFRQPVMADIAAAGPGPVEAAILTRCALDGPPPADAGLAAAAATAFEALDPLAVIVVAASCPDCAAAIAASVEPATFVAAAIDRVHDMLMRDIDMIAGGYGWSEDAICALPAARRAHYVALIAARRATSAAHPRLRA